MGRSCMTSSSPNPSSHKRLPHICYFIQRRLVADFHVFSDRLDKLLDPHGGAAQQLLANGASCRRSRKRLNQPSNICMLLEAKE